MQRLQHYWSHVARRYPRAGAFISARFARGEYLGLHLTIGLVISLLALWLFHALAVNVLSQGSITRFDARLLQWLHEQGTPGGIAVFAAISRLASPPVLAVLALVGAFWLAIRAGRLAMVGWFAAFVGGLVLELSLKLLIQRPRPPNASALFHDATWSFPSGHAMNALIGYGMLAYLLLLLSGNTRWKRLVIIAMVVVIIAAIGWSRMYLGVHYWSDVLGGYTAGILWLSTCVSGIEVVRRRRLLHSRTVA